MIDCGECLWHERDGNRPPKFAVCARPGVPTDDPFGDDEGAAMAALARVERASLNPARCGPDGRFFELGAT